MSYTIKTSIVIITSLCAVKAGSYALGDMEKSETLPLKTQYPENAVSERLRRSKSAENENLLGIPENDIKKLLRIKALPSLNTALTKENCRAMSWFSSNIKRCHKEVNTAKILNNMFYKSRQRYTKITFNKTDANNSNNISKGTKIFKLMNEREISNTELTFVNVKTSVNLHATKDDVYKRTYTFNKNAFPLEISPELHIPQGKSSRMRFSNISVVSARRSAVLEFPDVPNGDVMKVPELKLEEEYFLFGFFSKLMGYLQPTSFPLGFAKDAVKIHASIRILILKALKLEGPVLGWIFVWLLLVLSLPCAVLARYCCPTKHMQRLNDDTSESSIWYRQDWMHPFLAIVMHLMLLLLLSCIILILATNEQISKSSAIIPNAANVILNDVEIFIHNTQAHISSVASSSVQLTVDSLHRDLEGAEELLGKPLQSALDAETGLETAMRALADLTEATTELSSRVSALLKDCNEARKVGKNLQGTLIELSRLLTVTRQECLPRDQALCDTLQTSGLNVSLHVDELSSDKMLQQLQEIGKKEDFNRTIEITRRTYQGLPRRVSLDTAVPRAGIRSALNRHRNQIYDAIQSLENLSRSLTEKLRSTKNDVHQLIQNVAAKDLWRWLIIVCLSLLIFFVWGLLMCGAPCGCDPTPKTIPFLLTGLGLTCVLSLILWAFGTAAFLLGGHCEAFICQPLYDQPRYTILGDLLNSEGILYHDEGLFNHFFKGNVSLRVDDVLRNCENNVSAYKTFNLQSIFNLDLLLNHNKWEDFNVPLEKFSVNLSNFEVFTPSLQQQLTKLSVSLQVNVTQYRAGISENLISKDLNSLADQLQSVAKQLSNLRSAEQMENLAKRTRNLENNEVQILKHQRDGIIYKMAALEVLIFPLKEQLGQSLLHLKTIQYFINSQGSEISYKVTYTYLSQLKSYLLDMHDYVSRKVIQDIGKCRPIWNAFHATRTIICKMVVDPMNGFSFACFLCILLFLGLAPVIIRTVAQYKEAAEDSFSSITHRRARNGFLIDDEGTWATPSPPSSSEEGQRQAAPLADLTWTTPRQPSEPLIPSPPRPPEPLDSLIQAPVSRVSEPLITRTSRILDPARLIPASLRMAAEPSRVIKSPIPRILQPGTSKAARDRHESLKLIEHIARRTPRSWL